MHTGRKWFNRKYVQNLKASRCSSNHAHHPSRSSLIGPNMFDFPTFIHRHRAFRHNAIGQSRYLIDYNGPFVFHNSTWHSKASRPSDTRSPTRMVRYPPFNDDGHVRLWLNDTKRTDTAHCASCRRGDWICHARYGEHE
jgi:hypothetical protein